MKPPAFDYVRAGSLDEALSSLSEHGVDARVIAGGQSLLPMLTMRLAKPAVLVDVMRLPELAKVSTAGDAIVVPAAVRQAGQEVASRRAQRSPAHCRSWTTSSRRTTVARVMSVRNCW